MFDFLGHPESRPAAAMIDDRHGVGEDIIELRDGLLGEQRRPFAALGLHAHEARLALQLLEVVVDALIVGDGEFQAAVGRDAVEDPRLAAVFQGLFQREIALEMDVVVDEGKTTADEPTKLRIALDDTAARRLRRGLGRQYLNANILEENLRSLRHFDRRRPARWTILVKKQDVVHRDAEMEGLSHNPEMEPLPILRDRLELASRPVA